MKKTVLTLLVATLLLTGCAEGKNPETTDDTSAPTSEATTTTTTTNTTETTKPALVASDMTITEVMTMLIEASGHSVDEALPEYKVDDGLDSYKYTKNKENVAQGIVEDRFFFFDYEPNKNISIMEVIKLDTNSELYKGLKVGDEIVSYFDEYKGYSPVSAIRGPYVLCITEALTTDRVDTEHNAVSGTYNLEPPYKNEAIQKAYEAFLTLE